MHGRKTGQVPEKKKPWTTGWGWTVGARKVGGLGGGQQRGKEWDNCNRTTIKYIFLKTLQSLVLFCNYSVSIYSIMCLLFSWVGGGMCVCVVPE